MADLLSTLAREKKVDAEIAKKILRVEKEHVYQKKRHTRGPISGIIEEAVKGGQQNDNQ